MKNYVKLAVFLFFITGGMASINVFAQSPKGNQNDPNNHKQTQIRYRNHSRCRYHGNRTAGGGNGQRQQNNQSIRQN